MLRVSEADVKRLLTLSKAIELVREAYVKLARGHAVNPARVLLSVPGGASVFFMPAYVYGGRTVTIKVARVNMANSRASLPAVLSTIYVYDSITGVQIAEVEGERLTAVRTAASTAVATDLLARKDVHVLGVFGSGKEAATHIPALRLVRDFDKVIVYSRHKQRRELFVRKMFRNSEIPVEAASSSGTVAKEADVIVTVTTSHTPVFNGGLVKTGSQVNAVGSATPEDREVDSLLVRNSSVVVDSRVQALATYGDIIAPLRERAIREKDIREIGELLTRKSSKVHDSKKTTLFKSGGLAVLDAVIADYLVQMLLRKRTRELGYAASRLVDRGN